MLWVVDDPFRVFEPERWDASLLVEFNARTRLVHKFEFCGETISDACEQLSLLNHISSTGIHSAIHRHQDEHYAQRATAGLQYDNMFRHGPILNEWSNHYPSIAMNANYDWFKLCLRENSELMQPAHNLAALAALMEHSKFVRFSLGARKAIFRLVAKHNVNVDPELFFINRRFLCSLAEL